MSAIFVIGLSLGLTFARPAQGSIPYACNSDVQVHATERLLIRVGKLAAANKFRRADQLLDQGYRASDSSLGLPDVNDDRIFAWGAAMKDAQHGNVRRAVQSKRKILGERIVAYRQFCQSSRQ